MGQFPICHEISTKQPRLLWFYAHSLNTWLDLEIRFDHFVASTNNRKCRKRVYIRQWLRCVLQLNQHISPDVNTWAGCPILIDREGKKMLRVHQNVVIHFSSLDNNYQNISCTSEVLLNICMYKKENEEKANDFLQLYIKNHKMQFQRPVIGH